MKKYENFCKALENLKNLHRYEPPYEDPVIVAGLCSLYVICFEQSWRAMKEYLWEEGWSEAASGSPRQILKTAYQAGLIQEERNWLKALEARNLQTHTYNEEAALQLITDTKNIYLSLFENLKKELHDKGIRD